jgi:hypothetical protein
LYSGYFERIILELLRLRIYDKWSKGARNKRFAEQRGYLIIFVQTCFSNHEIISLLHSHVKIYCTPTID